MVYYDKSGSRIYRPLKRRTQPADSAPDSERQNHSAAREAADNPEGDDETAA